MSVDVHQIKGRVAEQTEYVHKIRAELGKELVGQETMVSRLLVALLSDGHILLEGVPGLAKTLAIKSLAAAIHTRFRRIQFTPDLLPADLVGTQVFNPRDGSFSVKKGPIFSNFILADEVNRAPSKVQSALLEAMQERQVTIGEETFPLDAPFLVMATQNPIEQEGTYPLPEAQVDRFMLKVKVSYPKPEEERKVIDKAIDGQSTRIRAVATPEDIFKMREVVSMIYIDDKVKDYILSIVQATREPEKFKLRDMKGLIEYGASPRASINLALGARSLAFLEGRGYVTPQDVKDISPDVLRHRIILSYEAEAEEMAPEDVIARILGEVPVP
ncbi:MAG: MoxR family ATPase [Planctomycetes bacterium]|nr:MoxR family ATPase [Planctomycetota bacterium]